MRKCAECYHDGCCEGLPYCGGRSFKPSHEKCVVCGEYRHVDDLVDGLCEKCSEDHARCAGCGFVYENADLDDAGLCGMCAEERAQETEDGDE